MSDGSIEFNTKLNTKGIKKDLKDIEKEIDETNKRIARNESNYNNKRRSDAELGVSSKDEKGKTVNAKENQEYVKRLDKENIDLYDKRDSLISSKNDLIALQQEVEQYEKLSAEIDKVKAKLDSLTDKQQKMASMGVDQTSNQWKSNQYDIDQTKEKLSQLADQMANYNKSKAVDLKTAMDSASQSLERVAGAAGDAGKSITAGMSNAGNTVTKFGKKISETVSISEIAKKTAQSTVKQLLSMGNLIKTRLRRMLISGIINTMKTGITNLMEYSSSFKTTMNSMKSATVVLGNSFATAFAPILSVVVPVLVTLINYVTSAISAISRLFALLGSKSTYTRAKKGIDAVGKSAKAAGGAAKNATKALAGFDELNQLHLSDSSGGGGSGATAAADMFEEVPTGTMNETEEKLKSIMDNAKQVLANLKEGILEAWNYAEDGVNTNGQRIMTSLNNMKNTILDGLVEMSEATVEWSANLDFIPLFTAFAGFLESLEPLVQQITDLFVFLYEEVLLPIGKWAVEGLIPVGLDLLSAAVDVLTATIEALKPLGEWLWDSLLGPIASWTGGVIVDVLGWVAEKLEDISDWISQNQGLVQTLAVLIGSVALAFQIYYGALNAVHTAMLIYNTVAGLAALVTGALNLQMLLVIGVIAAVIAIAVLLALHWDEVKAAMKRCWDAIVAEWELIKKGFKQILDDLKQKFQQFVNWLSEKWTAMCTFIATIPQWIYDFLLMPIWDFLVAVVTAVIEFFQTTWDSLWAFICEIPGWIKNSILDPIHKGFKDSVQAIYDFIINSWNAIKTVFATIAQWTQTNVIDPIRNGFKTAVNGIIGFFEGLANGVARVMESIANCVADAINSISFDVPDWVPFAGGSHVGFNVPHVSLGRVSLPRLATGTVVPPNAGEFAAILGDNKRDTEVVSPLDTLRQAVMEALAASGITNNQQIVLKFDGDLAQLARILKPALDKESKRKGSTLVLGGVR